MSRTRMEIDEELAVLKGLANEIPAQSAQGEDNHDAINAQIRVIEDDMSFEDMIVAYDDDEFILSAAIDARRWLKDDDEPVSETWLELVTIGMAA